MKSASTGMQSHLQSDCTTLARLYKITRKDGTVYTFTDHDQDISTKGYESYFSDANPSTGGWVYEAAMGMLNPSAIENHSDITADNQEVTAVIDSELINENDLRFGLWDTADVEIRLCNWANLTEGEVKLRKGVTGTVKMKNGVLTVEVLGLTNPLQQLQGRSYGPTCDAELGDSRCQATVPVETGSCNTNPSVGTNDSHHITPYAGLAGNVGGVSNVVLAGVINVYNPYGVSATEESGFGQYSGGTVQLTDVAQSGTNSAYTFILLTGQAPTPGEVITISGFTESGNNTPAPTDPHYPFTVSSVSATSYAQQSGYYDDGVITFTSGGNSGLSFQVKFWDGATLYLQQALFVPVQDGDTFTIIPGCDHSIATCKAKFNNVVNFQGFPSMPGQDAILMYPDATGSGS